jgi:hypothetical protein
MALADAMARSYLDVRQSHLMSIQTAVLIFAVAMTVLVVCTVLWLTRKR